MVAITYLAEGLSLHKCIALSLGELPMGRVPPIDSTSGTLALVQNVGVELSQSFYVFLLSL